MHTANRPSQLNSSPWIARLRRVARIALPVLLAISGLSGVSFIEARRGGEGRTIESAKLSSPASPISALAAATITVNDPGDAVGNDGKCTLREAITAANLNMTSGAMAGECAAGTLGADTIIFSLGTGTPTINLTSALPAITEPVTITGDTGGATRVELNGVAAGANANGLTISAGSSVIERLVINRFTGDGIQILGAGFNTVKGCILGLDSSGTIARPNSVGLAIRGSSDNTIGSTVVSDRNTISGNTTDGVLIIPRSIPNPPNPPTVIPASRNKVINSYIGSDVTGRFDLGNTGFGVNISGGDASVIGGATTDARNVISGNNGGGVRIGTASATNNKVIGNYIGLDASSVFPLGNGVSGGGGTAPGVLIEDAANNTVGGTADGEFNFIKYNLQNGGVVVKGVSATGNGILRNYIANNAGLGIDLGGDGITANDLFDGDSGPNNLQNRPVLTGVSTGSNSTTISGTLSSQSFQSYRIEFFFNSQCDPSGSGEGENYVGGATNTPVGFINVNTDILGSASFSPTFDNFVAPAGTYLTATATRISGSQDTSEFSSCLLVPGGGPTNCTPTFVPQASNFRSPGGTASISVMLAGGCSWMATSSLPWVSIQSGASGSGSGTVVISVSPNTGTQRLGQITIAGQNYNISQEGPCTASLNPAVRNFTAAGGTGTVELITGSGCPWMISNANSWITINSATSGTGPTFVDFTVAPNTGTALRVGLVVIAGQNFAVIQDQPCGSTINPTSQMAAAGGGNYSVSITIPAGCNWSATKNDPWITLTGATSGTGNGTVTYSVAANTGAARTGSINVAGKSLPISQDSGCQPTFNPTNQSLGAGAGSHSFDVSIGSSCDWTPTTATPWITITSPGTTGNGTVNYSVTANPGSQRVGTITVAGMNFAVLQDGACSYSLSKTNQQFPVQGGTDSVNVTAPGGCGWTATTQTPWIVITSGASGSGNGTVNFLATTNGTGSQRVGIMTVAGTNVIVQQEGGCTYSASPTTQNAPAAGGGFTASVSAAGGCAWTASSNDSWITITSGASGSGNGNVGYSVAANTGPPRTGTLFAAGELVTVHQASGCPISVSPANLSAGQLGVNYSQQFTQTGGIGTITWSVSSGSAPSGLTLDPSTGVLSGVPTVPAIFMFTIRAADTTGCYGETPYMLAINCQPLSITPTTLNNTVAGAVFNQALTLNGDSGLINWSVSAGALPMGLSVNPNSGVLSGIPSVTGTFNFTIKAIVNATGCFATQALSLTVNCPTISITPASLATATIGTSYNQQLAQTGGVGNITWSLFSGTLPTNLTLSTGGLISGTPNVTGSFPITVRATDANNCFTDKAYTLTVGCQTITIGPATLAVGTPGAGYNQQLTQTGGNGSVTWSLSGGVLPNNLTLSSGGLISGTPAVSGSFPITVRATDANGCFADKDYTLGIGCQTITVAPATLNPGTVGSNYNQQLTQTGGIGTMTWSVSLGSLPAGVTLNPSSGLLSGIPAAAGTFNIKIRASESGGCFGEQAYQFVVNCQSLSITPASLGPILIVTPYNQQLTLTGGGGAMTWAVTAGALPSGVTLDPSTGLLSGSPNVSGTFNFTVKATINSTGCFAQQAYTLVVNCPTITVNPATINNGNLGVPYSQQFTQTGGAGNINWSISSGSLPNNLTLTTSGLLSGTPTMSGSYPITVRATDGNGCFGERSYTLTIGTCPAISITPNALPSGLINTAYNQTLMASGGTPGYTFAVTGGALPAGVSLSGAGAFSGAPTVVGTFNFTVTATDQAGCTGTKNYSLVICSAISINPTTLPSGIIGSNYSQMLTANGGAAPLTFSSSGALPTGLSLSSSGLLFGTPSEAGTFNFTVTVTDAGSCTGSQNYTVVVTAGLMFYPLPRPVRLMDTRAGQGNCDNVGAPIAAGTSLTTLARTTCEGITIPATAQAVVGNLTVINQSAQSGYLTIYPDGVPAPLASNMIYAPGQIIANNFTVALSSDGKFNVFGERTIDVVIDISGYFAPPGAGGLYYHPLATPVRLLDTRPNEGTCDNVGTPITGGTSITTQARITCGGLTIPAAAQALVANATVVNVSGQLGFLTIYPNGVPVPQASNMIYYPGQIISNALTVSLNPSGEFNIFGERTIHMIIDVAGYYSAEATDANGQGLLFNPLPRPVRILDTRPGAGNCDAVSTPIAGGTSIAAPGRLTCEGITIPAAAQSVLGNVTVINQTSQAGYLTLYPDGVSAPLVSNMVYAPGQLLSNAFVVGVNSGTGQFRIFAERTLDAIVDASGYFAP